MARPIRIQYPDAVYHVMARGNQGRDIFRDDKDRKRFLETVGEACQKTGWEIHAFAGHDTRVTQAISRMRNRPGRKLRALRSQLLRALNDNS